MTALLAFLEVAAALLILLARVVQLAQPATLALAALLALVAIRWLAALVKHLAQSTELPESPTEPLLAILQARHQLAAMLAATPAASLTPAPAALSIQLQTALQILPT